MPVKQQTRDVESNGEMRLPVVGKIPVRRVAVPVPVPQGRAQAVIYYGALGGLAVLEIVEWPVVALLGVGYAFLSRQRRMIEEDDAD